VKSGLSSDPAGGYTDPIRGRPANSSASTNVLPGASVPRVAILVDHPVRAGPAPQTGHRV